MEGFSGWSLTQRGTRRMQDAHVSSDFRLLQKYTSQVSVTNWCKTDFEVSMKHTCKIAFNWLKYAMFLIKNHFLQMEKTICNICEGFPPPQSAIFPFFISIQGLFNRTYSCTLTTASKNAALLHTSCSSVLHGANRQQCRADGSGGYRFLPFCLLLVNHLAFINVITVRQKLFRKKVTRDGGNAFWFV